MPSDKMGRKQQKAAEASKPAFSLAWKKEGDCVFIFPIISQPVSHLTVLCEDTKPSFEYSVSLLAADLMKDAGEYFS